MLLEKESLGRAPVLVYNCGSKGVLVTVLTETELLESLDGVRLGFHNFGVLLQVDEAIFLDSTEKKIGFYLEL